MPSDHSPGSAGGSPPTSSESDAVRPPNEHADSPVAVDADAEQPTSVTPIALAPIDPLREPWPNAWKFYRGMWLFWLVLACGAVAYIVVRATVPQFEVADSNGSAPTCLMKSTTGVPCPFCGGTRSATWTVQGRFERALLFQPLGPLYLLLFAASIPLALWGMVAPARANRWFRRWILKRYLIFGLIALTLGVWLARAIVSEESLIDLVDQREAAAAS